MRSCGENTLAKHSPRTREAGFAATSKHSRLSQNLVRQRLANPAGMGRRTGGERPAARERPPENGPGLGARAFRRGRSRDFSLQEGWVALGMPGASGVGGIASKGGIIGQGRGRRSEASPPPSTGVGLYRA